MAFVETIHQEQLRQRQMLFSGKKSENFINVLATTHIWNQKSRNLCMSYAVTIPGNETPSFYSFICFRRLSKS